MWPPEGGRYSQGREALGRSPSTHPFESALRSGPLCGLGFDQVELDRVGHHFEFGRF